jgi:dolichol-phosphate mannosyltransferase
VTEPNGSLYDLIVVDDDSPDRTWRIAREVFADDDRVTVIRRIDERGLSSAVLDGFRAARGRICVCMDADGQHPPDRLEALVDEIETGADLAVGSRHVDGGRTGDWPTWRAILSGIGIDLAHVLVPAVRSIADPMSGFFAVDRTVFDDEVLALADPHGYKLLLELATLVPDAEIAEVPITFCARAGGESKLTLDEQLRCLEHLLDLWWFAAGLDEYLSMPLLVRSLEAATVVAVGLVLLHAGLVIGTVESALGAGLIAASGATIVLGLQRLARAGVTWTETDEVFAK